MAVRDVPPATRHDPAAADGRLVGPFGVGASMVGKMKGSQAQYERVSLPVAAGSVVQPALGGMYPHPIPPPKGDRW